MVPPTEINGFDVELLTRYPEATVYTIRKAVARLNPALAEAA